MNYMSFENANLVTVFFLLLSYDIRLLNPPIQYEIAFNTMLLLRKIESSCTSSCFTSPIHSTILLCTTEIFLSFLTHVTGEMCYTMSEIQQCNHTFIFLVMSIIIINAISYLLWLYFFKTFDLRDCHPILASFFPI